MRLPRRLLPLPRRARRALAGGLVALAFAVPADAAAVTAPPQPDAALPPPPAPVDPTDPAVTEDPGVLRARAELDASGVALGELVPRLDAAVATYEHTQAHHLRLAGERDATHRDLATLTGRLDVARTAFEERVANAYMRPGAEFALGGAVLTAPDPATALHRTALIERLVAADPVVSDAEAARDRTVELARQDAVLDAGTAGTAAARKDDADALARTVAAARQRVDDARRGVASAVADAIAREEARRQEAYRRQLQRLEAQRRTAELAALGIDASSIAQQGAPPPVVDGKVCPVGLPNGFIDSWGFPRSENRRHQGVDIFAAHGTPLYAVADGRVARVTNNRLGGLSVHLVDDAGDRYYYAHLSAYAVKEGQRVQAGDVLGTVGNTGNARTTPPHLHWQYHPDDGPPVNPYPLARALCRP